MSESRANRARTANGEWEYLDQDDAEFVLMSWPEYSIEAVDDFVDSGKLPEETILMLRGIRHEGLQAYIANDFPLMMSHLRCLHMACRAAGMLDAARVGVKFKRGRKPNTGGPIRKAVAKLLANSPSMKNPALWEAIKNKPPRGWKVFDNRAGKYIEGPKATDKDMGYARFCTVAGEERKKTKS